MIRDKQCPQCEKWFSEKGLRGHIWKAHGEGKFHNPKKGTPAWNKGLSKETDERVKNYALHLEKIKKGKVFYRHTDESKENLRQWAIKNNLGGHTSKKKLVYKNFLGEEVYLQSSFEETVAKELDRHQIKWTRPKCLKWIDSQGKEHRYYPDFYLIDENVYLDPKNDFLILKDKEKIEKVRKQNNIKLFVLDKTQLEWNKIKQIIS